MEQLAHLLRRVDPGNQWLVHLLPLLRTGGRAQVHVWVLGVLIPVNLSCLKVLMFYWLLLLLLLFTVLVEESGDDRLGIVKELLRTEDTYLENLRNIFDIYMEPLK